MFLTNNDKFFSFQKMFHVKHCPFYIFSLQIPVACDFVITNPLIVVTNAVWVTWGDKNIIF